MRGHAVYSVSYAYIRLHIQRERHSLTRRVSLQDTFLSVRYATAIKTVCVNPCRSAADPKHGIQWHGDSVHCNSVRQQPRLEPAYVSVSRRLVHTQSRISNQAAPALCHGCMWRAAHGQGQHTAVTCLCAWGLGRGKKKVAGGCATNMRPWDYSGSNREANAASHRALATSAACHTPGRRHQTRCSQICHRGRLTLA